MIDLRCEYLSVRNSLKLDIAPVSRKPFFDIRGTAECIFTLYDNIQGLHFPGAIKIVATMIHYCYCLIHCCYCFESEE